MTPEILGLRSVAVQTSEKTGGPEAVKSRVPASPQGGTLEIPFLRVLRAGPRNQTLKSHY